MKNTIIKRAVSLLLALVCVMGVLPLSAFAAGLSSAPGSITQRSSDYMKIGGRSVRYRAASSVINNVGLPYVFDEQVEVPDYGPTRALCAYQKGTLGPAANGQKWNYKEEVTHPSLKVLLTFIYSHTYGNFTDAGNAVAAEHWNQYWSDIWFMVAQAMSWYYEHGILKDVNSDREGFINQAAEEFVAAMKLYHDTYGQSSFIKDWSKIDIHSIIDSSDGGATGNSAYDYVSAGVKLVLEHSEYYKNYHLWIYEWDKSQPWKLAGQSGVPMQRLLIAVPEDKPDTTDVSLTVKKLEAGTNKPLSGVSFTIKSADEAGGFSVTKTTGADGTVTLTKAADGLTPGQYLITEDAVPEGYVAQTASQLVTVLPSGSANSVFTFYNEPEGPDTPTPDNPTPGTGSIRKVNADDPTEGIPGAVIRITSVKLDDGGSFFGEYTTKDGGYILKEDLDFSKLPTGAYLAEEITPPEGYILSSDVSKVKQPFVWDGKTDVSLVFENSSKVKVQLKKVDESNQPLSGAIFVVLRDGQVISTEETQADGTITVSNVTEGYYEFREASAPAGFDCDRSPVGVHVEAEDLQGEQTIVVTKMNHHKRTLTIQKRDAETGDPIPGTSFHVRGVNLGYENDVVTGADGSAVLESMPSGCYEITETDVPKPYILDSNNRKTVWIDAEKDKDVVVDFVNSKLPGVRLLKLDRQTNKPIPNATFKIEEVDGGFTDQRQTDKDGMGKLLEYHTFKIKYDETGKEIWKTVHRGKLVNHPDIEIITKFNAEIRGIYNYYRLANNVSVLGKFAHIMEYSMYKTFACKYRTTVRKIIDRYSDNGIFYVPYQTKAGMKRCEFYHDGFKRIKEVLMGADTLPEYVRKYTSPNSNAARIKRGVCELCGQKTDDIRMHHVRRLKDLTGGNDWEMLMRKMRRKSLAVCKVCHEKIHS